MTENELIERIEALGLEDVWVMYKDCGDMRSVGIIANVNGDLWRTSATILGKNEDRSGAFRSLYFAAEIKAEQAGLVLPTDE